MEWALVTTEVEVGHKMVLPAYTKVSLLPQPSKQDSDEELEYADANTGVIESPCLILWPSCGGGNEDEWRHSISPIPAEKLLDLLQNKIADYNALEPDMDSIRTSGELQYDSESTHDDGDDYKESVEFEKEVEATFQRALTGVVKENIILEINLLRISSNMSHADCAGALFHSIMKEALVASYSCKNELYVNTVKEINKWMDLLKCYLMTVDEEIEVILKFEEISSETAREFSPLFSNILTFLYHKEILSEAAILSWAQEKEGADESDKIFTTQSEQFIKWLREASEEEDD